MAQVPQTFFDALAVRTWCGLALETLGRAREEIDAINVYPVADGDTGTNLYLTVESAVAAVEFIASESVANGSDGVSRLVGASGATSCNGSPVACVDSSCDERSFSSAVVSICEGLLSIDGRIGTGSVDAAPASPDGDSSIGPESRA